MAKKRSIFFIGPKGAGKSTLVSRLGIMAIDTDDFLLGTRVWRKRVTDEREACDFTTMLDYADKILALDQGESLRLPAYDGSTGLALAASHPYPRQLIGKVPQLVISGCLNPFSGEQWQTKGSAPIRKADIYIYLYASDMDHYNALLLWDVTQMQRHISEELLLQFNMRQESQLKCPILPELENANLVLVMSISGKDDYTYSVYVANTKMKKEVVKGSGLLAAPG